MEVPVEVAEQTELECPEARRHSHTKGKPGGGREDAFNPIILRMHWGTEWDFCMQKLPPQQAGKQQVHTYPLHCSTEGLQVRPQKQLRKYGWLAAPKAHSVINCDN
ncbi:hypothetical protein EYF80_016778 [Liparis tanakae]|uniref:Uncharacterized protein n=1 Tax=Liparis tanakae TaxID=230148 RepID=A0A4Z2I4V0_9TELE|nr:hypothetical protein EYF80_016778 [Liparis tanakae]